MTHACRGWLFGLEGDAAVSLTAPGLTVRAVSAEEADRIVRCSTDFFAHDVRMWAGALERYPFVYEKQWPDGSLPIGGEDGVAVLLSLLDPGEVRTPIQWSSDGQGGGGQASSSEAVALFFRSMNGKFHTVDIAAVAEPLGAARSLRRHQGVPDSACSAVFGGGDLVARAAGS